MEIAKEAVTSNVFEASKANYQQQSMSFRILHGLSAIVFSQKRIIWVTFDFFLSILFFIQCALQNPISSFASQYEFWVSAIIFSVCFCVIGLGAGLYDREHRFLAKSYFRLGFLVLTIALPVSLAVIYFVLYWKVSRYVLIFGSIGDFALLALTHTFLGSIFKKHSYRYVILGVASPVSQDIRKAANQNREGIRYFHVDELQKWSTEYDQFSPQEFMEALYKHQTPDIILTEQASKDNRILDLCVHAMQAGCRVIDEITFYSELFESFPSQIISENWLVLSGINTRRPLTNFAKRTFDVVLSAFCLIFLSPALLLISLIIKLTSDGPILFIQKRQGRYGKPIEVLKFRTMYQDSSNIGPPSTRINDPRITPIGKILRPLHLDELPQLWNILKGEMSFVGPRPEVYSFTIQITKEVPIYKFRNLVRPGLTGLSQISVGYTLDNAQDTLVKLAYDLYYVKNYNFFTDMLIMLRTCFVLTKRAR